MATPLGTTSIFEKVLQSNTITPNADVETLIIKFDEGKYEEYLHHLPYSHGVSPKRTPYCGAWSVRRPSLYKMATKKVE